MLNLLLPYPSVFDRRVFILMHTKERTGKAVLPKFVCIRVIV